MRPEIRKSYAVPGRGAQKKKTNLFLFLPLDDVALLEALLLKHSFQRKRSFFSTADELSGSWSPKTPLEKGLGRSLNTVHIWFTGD